MKIGYARVSTEDQNLDLQHDALMAAGCDRIFEDKLSGVAKRPGLDAALAALDVGDMLMVWKLDRLGRSSAELVRIGDDLRARGIDFKVLTGQGASIDTTRPEGRFFYTVMAAFAELDREITRERTIAGLAAARRRGKRLGRPP
ncbi:recombinase family protein, partial [Aureimonas sp. AU12]|uniref:recombinase family protein n=1 Tax=Aureimonas sp. AU12 TaxID=1638161 RepID=UPI00078529EB